MKLRLLLVALLLTLVCGSCSDSPTTSQPTPVDHSDLLLSRLCVAITPGGSTDIEVEAYDIDGNPQSCTFQIADASVVSATQVDSTITVTGMAYGKTTLTISTTAGHSRVVPITVYDPYTMVCGELQFQYATAYDTTASYAGYPAQFYNPVPPSGYRSFGSIMTQPARPPFAIGGMLIVKAAEGSTALAEPTRYDRVDSWPYFIGFPPVINYYRPIPPGGYKALGMVVASGVNPVVANTAICIREDLTVPGVIGPVAGRGAGGGLDSWLVAAPAVAPGDSAYLAAGGVIIAGSGNPSAYDPVLNALKIDLPVLIKSEPQTIVPHLSSLLEPQTETKPLAQYAIMVPWTAVKDPLYPDTVWRTNNSPFYLLQRDVFYKRLYHNYNSTSVMQENNITITKGVITDSASTYYNETSIVVSFEAGISLGKASAQLKSTVTKKLGYSKQTSVAEFQTFSANTTIFTAPGKAAACWQKYNRLTLYRQHGNNLEVVKTWEFGIDDSYVTDEYPD